MTGSEGPKKKTSTWIGMILLLCTALVILIPAIQKDLATVHLGSALILGTLGGLLTDPATFREIAADLISNLPGGGK